MRGAGAGRRRRWGLATAAVLGVLAAAPAAPAAELPRFVGTACPVPLADGVRQGRDVRCGHVAVPVDHRRPERGEIRLAVAVLRARAEAPRSDAVLRLAGGPGEKLVAALSGLKGPQSVVGGRDRDVVLFDQRGVGYSHPALECPEFFTVTDLAGVLPAFAGCRARLGQNDLSRYTTAQSVADLDWIRRALGYRRVNLFGTSYGTYLALSQLRDTPRWVRSAVLSSPAPPNANYLEDAPASFQRALRALANACGADARCRAINPDVRGRLSAVLARLAAAPGAVTVPVTNAETGQQAAVPVLPETVAGIVFRLMYVREGVAVLPALIAALDRGVYRPLGTLLSQIGSEAPISLGMQLSVQCAELVSRASRTQVAAAVARADPVVQTLITANPIVGLPAFDVCAAWGVPARPGAARRAVSDVPALVATSRFDPITPPSYGALALRGLANGIVVRGAATGHAPLEGLAACGLRIVQAFLDAPGTRPDARCAAEPVEFIAPEAAFGAARRALRSS